MATFFKDFGKEAKDLLTKNTAEGKGDLSAPVVDAEGKPVLDKDNKPVTKKLPGFAPLVWKAECKSKLKAGSCAVINPVADSKGVVVNFETQCDHCCPGAKAKFEVKQDLMATKPTVTYEKDGRKVEVSTESLKECCQKWSIAYEDKQKVYTAIAKIDGGKKVVTLEDSVPVIPGLVVGGSVEASFGMALKKWNVGLRYAACKTCVGSVTTEALKKFNVSIFSEIPGVKLPGGSAVQAATQLDYDLNAKASPFKATVGFAGKVPHCPCNSSWKLKFDTSAFRNVSFSHNVNVGCWNLAWTYDHGMKSVGMLLTCE